MRGGLAVLLIVGFTGASALGASAQGTATGSNQPPGERQQPATQQPPSQQTPARPQPAKRPPAQQPPAEQPTEEAPRPEDPTAEQDPPIAQPPATEPAQPVEGQPPATTPPATAAVQTPILGRVFGAEAGMIFNPIRPERALEFEQVMAKLRAALAESSDPVRQQQAAGWKVFKSVEPGPNGTVLYIFVMDPAVKGADYTVSRILADAYPAEVQMLYKLYSGAYAGSQSLVNLQPLHDFSAPLDQMTVDPYAVDPTEPDAGLTPPAQGINPPAAPGTRPPTTTSPGTKPPTAKPPATKPPATKPPATKPPAVKPPAQ